MCRQPCAAGQVAVEKVNFMVYERLSFVVTNSGTEKSTISSLQTISNFFALMIEAMKKKNLILCVSGNGSVCISAH